MWRYPEGMYAMNRAKTMTASVDRLYILGWAIEQFGIIELSSLMVQTNSLNTGSDGMLSCLHWSSCMKSRGPHDVPLSSKTISQIQVTGYDQWSGMWSRCLHVNAWPHLADFSFPSSSYILSQYVLWCLEHNLTPWSFLNALNWDSHKFPTLIDITGGHVIRRTNLKIKPHVNIYKRHRKAKLHGDKVGM